MIKFKSIKWTNLLSTGENTITIELNRSPTTLIIGENGAGKSTILDALCFGLFGRPFRKIKKQQLVNSINGKKTSVEIEFEIYGKQYHIIRTIKPNTLEIYIDGVLLDQPGDVDDYQEILEKTILRMNMRSFTQIVVLGSSSFVPFMQLASAARSDVVQNLLDIQVFAIMLKIAKNGFPAGRFFQCAVAPDSSQTFPTSAKL